MRKAVISAAFAVVALWGAGCEQSKQQTAPLPPVSRTEPQAAELKQAIEAALK